MLFFKINISKSEIIPNPLNQLQPKILRSITSDIEAEYDNKISVFAKDVPVEKHIYCITKEYDLIADAVSEFFEKLGIDSTKYKLKELTYEQIKNILSSASRNDMIEQESNILPEAFDFLSCSVGNEHLCRYSTKKKIESSIEFSPYHDELMEEFQRIYKGSAINNCRYRIPVHYIIETTDEYENTKIPVEALVSTLHAKNRVLSSRYNILNDSDMSSINNLENISKDTTLVLDLRPCSSGSFDFMECMSFFSIPELEVMEAKLTTSSKPVIFFTLALLLLLVPQGMIFPVAVSFTTTTISFELLSQANLLLSFQWARVTFA